MSDPYVMESKGPLKLKGDSSIQKKKKKSNSKKLMKQSIKQMVKKQVDEQPTTDQPEQPKYTKAELAFKARQDLLREKRIHEKIQMTHKQRVEKFNKHLDSLTEHYDIPKVSWTK